MKTECTTTGPTVEDAVDAALEQLGVQQDAVEYEILQEPGRKVFGVGSDRQAEVRVWVTESYLNAVSTIEVDDSELTDDEQVLDAEANSRTTAELTDDELDQVADAAVVALKRILGAFGIDEPTIEEYEGDEGEIILDVIGADLGILIGRHGKTLDALQTTVGAITTKELGFRHPVVVDIEGYRHRRRQKVEEVARKAADRAARQHTTVRLRPMTAYERRIVHVALRNDSRVTTGSEGTEPFRQVVISPR